MVSSNGKNVIVTTSWDDGTISDLKLSGLLSKYSIKGTFYITKSYKWIEDPITTDEIQNLSKNFEIGAHTLTHPDLDKISPEEAYNEIRGSKQYLENILNKEVKMFCYPRGIFNPEIIEIVKRSGYIGARGTFYGNYIKNPFGMPISCICTNGSPLLSLRVCATNRLLMNPLNNWEQIAVKLFNKIVKNGQGIFHLYGHASLFEKKNEWDKIEYVLKNISNNKSVRYMTNSELVEYYLGIK